MSRSDKSPLSLIFFFAFLIVISVGYYKYTQSQDGLPETLISESQSRGTSKEGVGIQKDILSQSTIAKKESKLNTKVLSGEYPSIDLNISEFERESKIPLSKDDMEIASGITSAIIDTLFAEITDITHVRDENKHQIEVSFRWQSNVEMVRSKLAESFSVHDLGSVSYKHNENVYDHLSYTIRQPIDGSGNLGGFNALLEIKISLIVMLGVEYKMVTIATGHRNQNNELIYTLMPNNNTRMTILDNESLPVVFSDIKHDSAKLLRDVSLGIVLEKSDSGRTFRIELDNKSIQ